MILWQVQKERLKLEYEVNASAPFPREAGTGKYFIVKIKNTGNAKLDHVEFLITFDSPVIESFRFAEPNLVTDVSAHNSVLSGSIPLMNPDESVSVTITTFGQQEPRTPIVAARGPGATALPRSDSSVSTLGRNLPAWAHSSAGFSLWVLVKPHRLKPALLDRRASVMNMLVTSRDCGKRVRGFSWQIHSPATTRRAALRSLRAA